MPKFETSEQMDQFDLMGKLDIFDTPVQGVWSFLAGVLDSTVSFGKQLLMICGVIFVFLLVIHYRPGILKLRQSDDEEEQDHLDQELKSVDETDIEGGFIIEAYALIMKTESESESEAESETDLRKVVLPRVKPLEDYLNVTVWNVEGTARDHELEFPLLKTNLDFPKKGLKCALAAWLSALEEGFDKGWCEQLASDNNNRGDLQKCLDHLKKHMNAVMMTDKDGCNFPWWERQRLEHLIEDVVKYSNALFHNNDTWEWGHTHHTDTASRVLETLMELLKHLEHCGYQSCGFVANRRNLEEWIRVFQLQKGIKAPGMDIPEDLRQATFYQASAPFNLYTLHDPLFIDFEEYARRTIKLGGQGLQETFKGVCSATAVRQPRGWNNKPLQSPCLYYLLKDMHEFAHAFGQVLNFSADDIRAFVKFLQDFRHQFALKESGEGDGVSIQPHDVLKAGMALMILFERAHSSPYLKENVSIEKGRHQSEVKVHMESGGSHEMDASSTIGELENLVRDEKQWDWGEASTFRERGSRIPSTQHLRSCIGSELCLCVARVSKPFISNLSNLMSQMLARVKNVYMMSQAELEVDIRTITWQTERVIFCLSFDD